MNVLSMLKSKTNDSTWSKIMSVTAKKDSAVKGFAKIAGKGDVLVAARAVSVLRVLEPIPKWQTKMWW